MKIFLKYKEASQKDAYSGTFEVTYDVDTTERLKINLSKLMGEMFLYLGPKKCKRVKNPSGIQISKKQEMVSTYTEATFAEIPYAKIKFLEGCGIEPGTTSTDVKYWEDHLEKVAEMIREERLRQEEKAKSKQEFTL